ncbi:MAG: hypothetical protein VKK04_13735 [Synechococcales bacterium]|nr:hypothetical protein [Synechococcales bacterium]
MELRRYSVWFVRAIALPVASGLVAGMFPSSAIALFSINEYEDCVGDLMEIGIDAAEATNACGAAFDPDDVSDCVTEIGDDIDISAATILAACVRVRRPEEMAECVTDVNKDLDGALPLPALEYCTRTLLPERFADCVTGIQGEVDLPPLAIMDACNDTDYRATELFLPGVALPAEAPAEIPADDLAPAR